MFKNLVVVLLLGVIMIAPASSWADHGVQVLGMPGLDVIIGVQTGPDEEEDWEWDGGQTDAFGNFETDLDSDPTADFFRVWVDDDPITGYQGPDPNPNNEVPASWDWILFDDQEGWR